MQQVDLVKKKAGNDIIKKNKNVARPPTGKRATTANMDGGLDSVNIENGGATFAVNGGAESMFDQKAKVIHVKTQAVPKNIVVKKNPRQVIIDDLKALHVKPNPKKLKEVKERCQDLNLNFDQYNAKAKEE